jgi:hypothetical protein
MALKDERLSRKGLLKRAGVGAAALGAGSMLTASTASGSLHASTLCVTDGCALGRACPSGTPGCCFCNVNTEGGCVCVENVFCNGIPTCTSSSQCPPGWACTPACGQAGICAPHCGAQGPHTVCGTGPVKFTGATAN